jgi:hypothetical protein
METPEPNLPAGMQWLHGKYGRYFNDRHDGYGHLFQGRYKAIRQKTDEQLWQALRYVALNPVEAGLSKRARDYPWSSYGSALEPGAAGTAVGRLSLFLGAEDEREGRERYERLVEGEEPRRGAPRSRPARRPRTPSARS